MYRAQVSARTASHLRSTQSTGYLIQSEFSSLTTRLTTPHTIDSVTTWRVKVKKTEHWNPSLKLTNFQMIKKNRRRTTEFDSPLFPLLLFVRIRHAIRCSFIKSSLPRSTNTALSFQFISSYLICYSLFRHSHDQFHSPLNMFNYLIPSSLTWLEDLHVQLRIAKYPSRF